MKEEWILFDLDGTLWDSSDNVAESWNEVLKTMGEGYPRMTGEIVRSVMGKTMDEIGRRLMPGGSDEERERVLDACATFEVGYIRERGGNLMEGTRETLEELVRRGYRLGIVSNCQTGYIDAFLESMDMRAYFSATMEWGETELPKGENIRILMKRNDCKSAVYVGDTQGDSDAAKVAGIPFLHAAYGFGTADSKTHVLTKISDLLAIFQ